jgi:hypothetical protein
VFCSPPVAIVTSMGDTSMLILLDCISRGCVCVLFTRKLWNPLTTYPSAPGGPFPFFVPGKGMQHQGVSKRPIIHALAPPNFASYRNPSQSITSASGRPLHCRQRIPSNQSRTWFAELAFIPKKANNTWAAVLVLVVSVAIDHVRVVLLSRGLSTVRVTGSHFPRHSLTIRSYSSMHQRQLGGTQNPDIFTSINHI